MNRLNKIIDFCNNNNCNFDTQVFGTWVHCCNQIPVGVNLQEYINGFSQINGEICVSQTGGDNLFLQTLNYYFIVVIEGKCSYVFDHDVWSSTDDMGMRCVGGFTGGNRVEGWLVPAMSKIVAVISNIPGLELNVPVWENIDDFIFSKDEEDRFPHRELHKQYNQYSPRVAARKVAVDMWEDGVSVDEIICLLERFLVDHIFYSDDIRYYVHHDDVHNVVCHLINQLGGV